MRGWLPLRKNGQTVGYAKRSFVKAPMPKPPKMSETYKRNMKELQKAFKPFKL